MKRFLFAVLFAACSVAETVPFLPFLAPPPPVAPTYPASYSNNLELVQEAVKLVTVTTNVFSTACWYADEIKRLGDLGDTNGVEAVRTQWRVDRDALTMWWVEACRTNGLPVWTNGVPVWTNGVAIIVAP